MAVAVVSEKTVLTRYVLCTVADSFGFDHQPLSRTWNSVRRNVNSLERGEAHGTDVKCGLDSDGCFFLSNQRFNVSERALDIRTVLLAFF